MMKVFVAIVLALVVCVGGQEDSSSARLLASKNILNQYLVEGRELTVQYTIYNVGGSPALSVELTDFSFPEADFVVISGFMQAKWERLAPGINVTHAVVIRPIKSGYFNFTSAEISYLASDDTTEFTKGYSSAPGEGGIISYKDYDRKFSPHKGDWATFGLMCLPSLGIPYALWYKSMTRYSGGRPKRH